MPVAGSWHWPDAVARGIATARPRWLYFYGPSKTLIAAFAKAGPFGQRRAMAELFQPFPPSPRRTGMHTPSNITVTFSTPSRELRIRRPFPWFIARRRNQARRHPRLLGGRLNPACRKNASSTAAAMRATTYLATPCARPPGDGHAPPRTGAGREDTTEIQYFDLYSQSSLKPFLRRRRVRPRPGADKRPHPHRGLPFGDRNTTFASNTRWRQSRNFASSANGGWMTKNGLRPVDHRAEILHARVFAAQPKQQVEVAIAPATQRRNLHRHLLQGRPRPRHHLRPPCLRRRIIASNADANAGGIGEDASPVSRKVAVTVQDETATFVFV